MLRTTLAAAVLAALAAPGARAAAPLAWRDVTADSGLAPHLEGALNHAVAWGDLDGDGRPDLFLGNFCDRPGPPAEQSNGLFRQVEGGRFVPLPMPAVETRGRTSGAVLADLDNDGDLDLYVSNNMHVKPSDVKSRNEPSALYRNDGGRFVNVSAESGACPAEGAFGRDVAVLDYDGDGRLDLLVVEDKVPGPRGGARLLRNLGGLRFEDATDAAGLPGDLHGFGVAVGDVSGDGRTDVYVCGASRLFVAAGSGRFAEVEALRPVLDIGSRHGEEFVVGAVFGDVDNDGDLDLVIGTHFAPSRVRVYLNEGTRDGLPRLRNVTADLGIPALPAKAPACAIEDFDHDGWPDVYWSVWLAEGAAREPFICRGLGVRGGLPQFKVPALDGLDTSLLRQNTVPAGKRGPVYYTDGPPVDYDGDGDLDFFAGAWPEGASRLLRNESAGLGRWLQVQVVGRRMNRMGVGATVRVRDGQGRLLGHREISLQGGYSGSGVAVAHFGLGQAETVDVDVLLPGRAAPVIRRGVRANQHLVVAEPDQ